MSKRISGKGIRVESGTLDETKIRVKVLADVGEAIEWVDKGYRDLIGHHPKKYAAQFMSSASWKTALRKGMPERMEAVMAKAEEFIADAIAYDPRLVRKGAFTRSDDPSSACGIDAAALESGEEQPFYARPHRKLNSQRAWGECVRVVLSTDTNDITDDHASAFIATAKLAQQFRPLDIWWQGAWLKTIKVPYGSSGETYDRNIGTAFLVPILSGDLDFARMQFVLSHANRDNLSHKVAWGIAAERDEDGKGSFIDGGRGTNSLHPEGCDLFIPESGISPDGCSIGYTAACWAGLEWKGYEEVDPRCAVQVWEPKSKEPAKATE